MFNKPKFLVSSLIAAYALSGSLYAADYSNTSYYVAYDSADTTQYALVLPSVNKVYTLVAGETDLTQVDTQFSTFPTYDNGNLCFPALKNGASGTDGASTMANKCYDVKYFYTQKETISEGTAFMLYYAPLDRVYEGIAGDASSFAVVKDGDVITNANSITDDDYTTFSFDTASAKVTISEDLPTVELTGTISADKTLTADTNWLLNGQVVVAPGVTLTIEPGTTVAGLEGTNAWLMVSSEATLMAEGTEANPIVFTSEAGLYGDVEAPGQWGGVTIIGNSANAQTGTYEVDDVTEAGTSGNTSGSLKYVTINNSGIAVEVDKEINGLSLFGVSSTTTIENITTNRSGDDGVEIWGGDVNLKDVVIDGAQDDSFDTDSGWAGEVDGLTITNGKKAGIEMSGTSVGTYKNVSITLDSPDSEGGLYFKAGSGEVVGGVFENVNVTYNSTAKGAIAVAGDFDNVNSSFTNVVLAGSNTAIVPKATPADDDEAAEVQALFDAQF